MRTQRHPVRPAFTLVELLVVISVIALLMAILLVAMSRASGSAEEARTRSQLSAITQGLQSFVNDFGFEPPLVTGVRGGGDGILTPEIEARRGAGSSSQNLIDEYVDARYSSTLTLPAYLLGIGDLNGDGKTTYGLNLSDTSNYDDGLDGPGLRHPGDSRAWKAPNSSGQFIHKATPIGREYGPYLDTGLLKDSIREARFDANGARTAGGPIVLYELVDYRGNPIRYSRNWPTRSTNGRATLDKVPVELRNADSMARQLDQNLADDDAGLLELDRDVLAAKYMVSVLRDEDQSIPDTNNDWIRSGFSASGVDDVTKTRLKNITRRTVRIFP